MPTLILLEYFINNKYLYLILVNFFYRQADYFLGY